jgi:hypothetical protein
MRGVPFFNFPAFFEAEDELVSQGHEVFNPARNDVETYGPEPFINEAGDEDSLAHLGLTIRTAMKVDLSWICDNADAIALLPGWEKSKGATAEKALADCLGLETIYLD